ncbi:MAG: SDR family oxidoreductase [Chloroflexi bacterium]|nr:SDR family oxidoreductase [Chloroflexota bacterium]
MPQHSTAAASRYLDGKNALVVGGTSGIGRAIALRYAAEGASVVVAARHRDPHEGGLPTDELITASGGISEYISLDVAEPTEIERTVTQAIDRMGRLEILVCSAGTVSAAGDTRDIHFSEFDDQFTIDVRGTFLCAQQALKHFVPARYGKIVMVSSNFGLIGVSGLSAYCAAKAAVIGLARAMAIEFGSHGINVNALCPGATKTAMGDRYRDDPAVIETWKRMTPLRLGGDEFIAQANDVANAALFLASEESRFMTGACLVVDGGWTAH